MEHAQRVKYLEDYTFGTKEVLILILMEHAQRDTNNANDNTFLCLNPYFNGTCSKRVTSKTINAKLEQVLILILMEHAQRDYKR